MFTKTKAALAPCSSNTSSFILYKMTFPHQFREKNYNLIKLSSHSASEFDTDTPKSDKRRLVTSGAEQGNSR